MDGYRIGCTNRPLRCCCRLLFSLIGVKKKLSPAQEEEEENTERSTHTKDDTVYLYRCLLILEHGVRHTSKRQGSIYTKSVNPPSKVWVWPYFDFTTDRVGVARIRARTTVKSVSHSKYTITY